MSGDRALGAQGTDSVRMMPASADHTGLVHRILRLLGTRIRLARTALIRKKVRDQMRMLGEHGISIVSNNCVAGNLYELAAIRKETPTAGLWFSNSCFALFLKDLASGAFARWEGITSSNLAYDRERRCWVKRFDEGEIVFLHYASPELASEKWNKRLERIKGRELIVIAWPQGGLTREMLEGPSRLFRHFLVIGEHGPDPWDEYGFHPAFLRRFSEFAGAILSDRAQCVQTS